MAASSPGQDVKDPGYRNWLKVGMALGYMKRGLHFFVRNEVNLIHKFLINTIYGGTTVQHTQCTRCKASDIRQHKHTNAWVFHTVACPAMCHDWFTQLLNLFVNPRSDRIYWSNCDVTSWAYNPWECAKAYMPRGQKPTNTDPSESDAQALLTLMTNCKHFHCRLSPQGLQQTRKISDVRNTIMHAPLMKLTDTEMRNCIQEIINLLEDPFHLHSLPDCIAAVSDIKKIRDASVDVFIDLELDVKALRELHEEAIEKLQNELQELHQDMDAQKSDLQALHQDMDLQKSDLQGLYQDMDLQRSDLQGLHQDMNLQKSELRGLHQDMDLQKSELQGLCQDMDLHKSELHGLCQDSESHKSDLRELQQDMDLQKSDLQGLHQDMDLQRFDLQGLHQEMSEVKDIYQEVYSQKSDLEVIHKDIDSHKSDLEGIQKDIRYQNIRIGLSEGQIKLGKRKCDTRHRQLDSKVRKLSKQIVVSQERRKGSRQPTEKDVREIQLWLIKAYKHIQVISMSPVFDSAVNLKNLEDFYTDIVIEEEIEESVQQRKKGKKDNKEKVTSVRQLFEKGNKRVTRIMLKAPAGQGKSTFCRKLVHTWCSVQKKKLNPMIDATMVTDRSETSGLTDEDEMLRFDVLLYICLRDISDEKTLMDVLYTQFPLHESQGLSHRSHIEALIGQAENNTVLLIMDGLDEMDNSSSFIKKIMQRSLYPHLTVLATTRPWKIGQLSLIRSADIDLLLDLQGFSYENSMLFAKRIFDKYYRDKSALKQFKMDIWSNELIASLIHIPLLLLFIVHVWYEKKSFPQTIHELYLEIFNVMVNRYVEVIGRKQESKEKDDKQNVLLKIWPLESTTFSLTCKLRNQSLVQHFGEEFLAALCEVASQFLTTNTAETSLVFEDKTLVKLLGKDGLSKFQTALDLGILSNSESPGVFRKKICLTFLHKTVQEFLAAINICCREDRCNIFLDSLNTLDDVFQNENIIMFVAGISTIHCQKIYEKMYEICDEELDLNRKYLMNSDEYFIRDSLSHTRKHHMQNLCRLYKNCIREACGDITSLKLHSLYHNEEDTFFPKISSYFRTDFIKPMIRDDCYPGMLDLQHLRDETMKGKLLLSKCTQLKCLYLVRCEIDDPTLDLSEFTSLIELSLDQVTMKGKLLLSKCTQLKCLNLDCSNFDDDTLDLSECTSLTELSLRYVTMKGKLLLSKCTQLKCLNLDCSNFDDATLDLSEYTSLTELSLRYVTMKGKLLLSKCTQLKFLNLDCSNFDDATLDLSECTSLTELNLEDVTMKGKLLLSKCTQLKCLNFCPSYLDYITMNLRKSELEFTTLDLSECTSLTELSLRNVTMKGKLLLSKCTQLKCLNLDGNNFDDATLDLSECTSLTELSLRNVTMKGKLLLSKCTQLKCLNLDGSDIDDATLDLSECTSLTELSLRYVTMKGKLLLSKCTQLKFLNLDCSNFDDATLDLSECTSLTELNLEDVTMKGKLLLSKCTQLKCLNFCPSYLDYITMNLRKSELEFTTLDLSECTSLTELSLRNVTMKGKLLLSKCTQLKCLNLDGNNFDDATLDLSECTSLTELSLRNVTMKGKLLLSKCTQLKCLNLDGSDIDDATLDLSECTSLTELSLRYVTMKGKLLLSKCTQLKCLNLDGSDIDDATLDLSECTSLTELSLRYVTMKGKLLLSKCTQLKCLNFCPSYLDYITMNLRKSELEFTTLDLSECTSLTELSLRYVTMKGKLLLSKCTQLKCLNLDGNNFDDATLDLSECTSLTELSLRNVTMKGKLLLSKCTQLKCLNLDGNNFDDVTLDLSECTSLTELNLEEETMRGKPLLAKYIHRNCHSDLCAILDQTDELHELYSMDRLSCITLDNVEMCKISKGLMCMSLSQCTQLQKLSMKNMDLGIGQLVLHNMDRLSCIILDNVEMCKISKGLMCMSLSQCTQLQKLSMKNMDLGIGQLVLHNMDRLTCITLDNVEMCKISKGLMCMSLSQCTQLQKLSMKNMDLGIGQLVLHNMDRLTCITLDNVEMCKISKGLMCSSLSQCTQLQKLSMKNMDLGDVLLNLNSLIMNRLVVLTLDNIIMSTDSMEILCNRLSWCKGLRILRLKNLDFGNELLCCKSLNMLVELTLDNVTMHKYNLDMLCNSLSWCVQLEKLSLKNLDLGGGLLNLYCLNQLEELTLDNITMCQDSMEMLCNSLSQCKGLTTLSLKNLDLGDGLLRLDNIEELYFLTIDSVTMCKYANVMLCTSLSQCTGLRTLSLKHLDLDNALLSLDKMEELYDFDVNNVTMCNNGYMMLSNSMSKCTKLKHLQLSIKQYSCWTTCVTSPGEYGQVISPTSEALQ